MIITVGNIKGGVGKSTVAIHLARYFTEKMSTLLLDSDIQQSSFDWFSWRNAKELNPYVEVQKLASTGFTREIKTKNQKYDLLIVDIGGFDSGVLRNLLFLTNLLVVPTSLSSFDRVITFELMKLVHDAKEYNETLKTSILFNRLSSITKEKEYIESYKQNFPIDIHWLEHNLFERVAFRKYYPEGGTLFDVDKKLVDSKSYKEMINFCKEIEHVIF